MRCSTRKNQKRRCFHHGAVSIKSRLHTTRFTTKRSCTWVHEYDSKGRLDGLLELSTRRFGLLLAWSRTNNDQTETWFSSVSAENTINKTQVLGAASADMRMFPLRSEEEVTSFPLTKWKISEPPEDLALSREDGVTEGDIDLVIVPAVAFDSSCNRLGHGRGHYGRSRSESAPPRPRLGRVWQEINREL